MPSKRYLWTRVAFVVLLPILFGTAEARAEVKILLKGGSGSIIAERAWEQGEMLCWTSKGYTNCLPKDRFEAVEDQSDEAREKRSQAGEKESRGVLEKVLQRVRNLKDEYAITGEMRNPTIKWILGFAANQLLGYGSIPTVSTNMTGTYTTAVFAHGYTMDVRLRSSIDGEVWTETIRFDVLKYQDGSWLVLGKTLSSTSKWWAK